MTPSRSPYIHLSYSTIAIAAIEASPKNDMLVGWPADASLEGEALAGASASGKAADAAEDEMLLEGISDDIEQILQLQDLTSCSLQQFLFEQ